MFPMDTEAKLLGIVHQVVGDQHTINRTTDFISDLGADSLDMVDMILAVEDEWNIELSDEDAENVNSFGDLLKLVTEKLAED